MNEGECDSGPEHWAKSIIRRKVFKEPKISPLNLTST